MQWWYHLSVRTKIWRWTPSSVIPLKRASNSFWLLWRIQREKMFFLLCNWFGLSKFSSFRFTTLITIILIRRNCGCETFYVLIKKSLDEKNLQKCKIISFCILYHTFLVKCFVFLREYFNFLRFYEFLLNFFAGFWCFLTIKLTFQPKNMPVFR